MASKAATHTDEAVIQRCQEQDFLALCIVKSGFDNELCTDVTDACEVAELNALDLASGDVSCEEAAQRLFLVNTEAKKLLKVCSRMCAREGVNFGDGIADAESSEEERAETVQTASPPPEAIGEPSNTSMAAEADGPSQCTGTEDGLEASAPQAEGLTREQQEEQERQQQQIKEEQEHKQQQLKEEQLAAARAAFAPKAIPASAVTTAASAVQPMQSGFPPGFSPPPPLGNNSSKSHKPSPGISTSRKLSAYDGSSFGVRENTHTPSPIQSSRTTGRRAAAAPSPRTPPVNVVDFNHFISASVRQAPTPRIGNSVATSRYQQERFPSTTTKHHLSEAAMKPADMTTPTPPPKPMLTPEAMKPANMSLPSPSSPASSAGKDTSKPTLNKNRPDAPSAAPKPRMASYLRPTAAHQAHAAKRPKKADIDMKGRAPTGSVSLGGRTPPTPPIRPRSASTHLPARYVNKVMNDPYSPYLSASAAKAKREAAQRPQVHRKGADNSEKSHPSTSMNGSHDLRPHHPAPHPDASPSPLKALPEFDHIRPNLLKPTKAFLAATNGNSQRRGIRSSQASTSTNSSSSRINHSQSAILSPADVAPSNRTFKARPMPKFMRPQSSTGPNPSTTSPTQDTNYPFLAMASTPGTPGISSSVEKRHPTHQHTGLQHKHRSHSDPEEDDLDDWFSERTPSGKQYITASMLQPHPHIPMSQLASESSLQNRPPWRSSSRVPRLPADDQLRMSLHKGTLIPNASGQASAAQVQHSIQLRQQHEQQQALMRALSEANYRNALEKAEAMRRSHRSPKSGSSSMRASQHQETVGNSDEQRSQEAGRDDKDGNEAREEECRVGTPPTPDPGSAVLALEFRELDEAAHCNDTQGKVEEGQ